MNKSENDKIDFIKPYDNEYTIYSKSGCLYCKEVKYLLIDKKIKYKVIDCDPYLIENKQEFLTFIRGLANKDHKTFPIVFNNRGQFIGGYTHTKEYLERTLNNTLDFNQDF